MVKGRNQLHRGRKMKNEKKNGTRKVINEKYDTKEVKMIKKNIENKETQR